MHKGSHKENAELKKHDIRDAFLIACEKQGYDKITYAEVSRLAGYYRATVRKYYPEKTDIVNDIKIQFIEFHTKALNICNGNPSVLIKCMLEYIKENRRIFYFYFFNTKEILNRPNLDAILNSDYYKALDIDKTLSQDWYLFIYRTQGFVAALKLWIQDGCTIPTDEFAEKLMKMLK